MQSYQNLVKEPESRARIRFQDCDPFGHLNNARFIDYFMNARFDQLIEHYDFNIQTHGQQSGNSWVVTRTQIAYLWPALSSEEVLIRTRLLEATDRKLLVEGLMFDGAGQRPKAVLWIEFTYISLGSGRPVNHSAELMALFNGLVIDSASDTYDFNARVETIKQQYARARVNQPAG